ncbi:MAG: HAD-IIA family hydrolase [Streptosporangiales bacterium]|nr:HAD-IIA family hydrolase [Streptosporangiales bacterium]
MPLSQDRRRQSALREAYDTVLLDLDGVVYVGDHAVAGAVDAIAAVRSAGTRVAFVTNNASRTPETVAESLRRLGVDATASDVVTAAQAAARLLAGKVPPGSAVLVVGGVGLRSALEERGLCPVDSADDDPVAVVQGFAPDLDYARLAEGAIALRAGALFVASNLDRTLPSPRGPLPGNGSLVEVLRHATGVEPISAGKPEPALHEEAVQRTGARRPLVVGDRLDTDIAGAVRAGSDSLLVMTGVTRPADLLRADASCRPTYVASDLAGLLRPYPEVVGTDGGWTCGGWTATVDDGVVRLDGDGGYDDALRVTCAAAWSATEPPVIDPALDVLR